MNKEIDGLGRAPGEASRAKDAPATPESAALEVQRQRPALGSEPAPAQPKRKTQAGASAPKRRKRFVL